MTTDNPRFIRYRGGYKFQLAELFVCETTIRPERDIQVLFIRLCPEGELKIFRSYAWDGPSGPVLNRRKAMRASLVHDALYQLMRIGQLDADKWREPADKLFRDMCVEDGVYRWLAFIYYHALRRFGKVAAMTRSAKREFRAP